jgi:hypothetical protein
VRRLRGPGRGALVLLLVLAAAGFSAAAALFAPLTAPAEFAVLAAGTALVVWAMRPVPGVSPPRRLPAPDGAGGRGALVWLALLLVFTAWELYALFASPAVAHPTVSALSGPLLAPHWHRAAAYLLWLAGGVWLARR